jgi:hypothetical protein
MVENAPDCHSIARRGVVEARKVPISLLCECCHLHMKVARGTFPVLPAQTVEQDVLDERVISDRRSTT